MDGHIFYTLFKTIITFGVLIVILVIVLATLGKSLGIRRRYIQLLTQVFEFGRRRINSYAMAEKERLEQIEGDEVLTDQESVSDDSQSTVSDDGILISRDISISAIEGIKIPSKRADYNLDWKREFSLSDAMYFAKCGAEAIIQDDVTVRFSAEELRNWNFLSRTDRGYHFISMRLTILWCLGCFVRYFVLLPFRLTLCFVGLGWLIVSTFMIGYFPEGSLKKKLNWAASVISHRILCRAMSAVVTFHNSEHRASSGICVANHTSPIDIIILSSDNGYAMVGQSHTGFLGIIQRALSRATAHIWFERSEVKDRMLVTRRLQEHVDDEETLPILIFPEGTCVNNTSVMMFKKGGFEVSPIIYPVAIKYDSRFGDAFWNSSKESMVRHIFNIMTSWALVVDVWYLPPLRKLESEDAIKFANRTKSVIARQGGLMDLEWDGQLKRMRAKDSWKSKPQQDYCKLLKVE